jgi:cytochrome c oxidase subunit 1
VLFVVNLLATHGARQSVADREIAFAETAEPLVAVPPLLNGFALWNWLVLVLMAVSWAYPIGQFFVMKVHGSLPWPAK